VSRTAIILIAAPLTAAIFAVFAETLPIRAYTTVDGLAHDHVNRIYRDSRDFLWICTDDGLSRLDGRRFVNYTVATGLPHMHVNDIVEARNGDYWIATDGGLALLRPDARDPISAIFRPDGPPQTRFVNAVIEDREGAILAGTSAGLFRLRESRFERIAFPAPTGVHEAEFVNVLFVDGSGTLWVGAATGLYRRTDDARWDRFTVENGLPHNFVGRIVPDPTGRLWACTRHGLVRIVREPRPGAAVADLMLNAKNGLPHDDVRAIAFTSDGTRWIGTFGGLVRWNSPSGMQTYTDANGLTDRTIYAIAEDPERNLWIGARRGGVMRVSVNGFHTFNAGDGLDFSGDGALVETADGKVCVASLSHPRRATRCFDGQRFRTVYPNLPTDILRFIPTSQQSTLPARNGGWWISSKRGVVQIRGKARKLRLLPNVDCRQLFEDSRGDLWIGVSSAERFGLFRWDGTTRQLHDYTAQLPDAARDQNINAIAEAPPGQIWIGLARPGGVYRLIGGRFRPASGAPQSGINAIRPDRAGRLWISTAESGLGRIDNPADPNAAIRLYTRSDGLSSDEIWSVAEDRAGRIYAGTARGVDCLDPETGEVAPFSVADGLAPGDVRSSLADRRGALWFLTNRGLSRLQPVKGRRHVPPSVRIDSVRVGGALYWTGNLGSQDVTLRELPYNRNSIQVDYSAVDYGSAGPRRYRFQLEGSASGWSEPAPSESVQLANLAPGHYRFLVRAEGSSRPASVTFSIAPPFWQRWWFVAAWTLAAALVAWRWHRSRLLRLAEIQLVRSRIAADLHDDVGAGLCRVAMMSEVLKAETGSPNSVSQGALGEIAAEARGLVADMSDIVWSIDPRRDTLGDLISRLRAFGFDVLEPRGIRWTFEIPDRLPNRNLSPDQRRQLYLILKEAIHNVARHSSASAARLAMRVEGGVLWAMVEDNGRGYAPGRGGGMGLSSMRERARRLGGDFEVAAGPEGGVRATLRLPLHKPKSMIMRLLSRSGAAGMI
jgi:ligand-binding sensor domain-containing protein/signal transduction histidine kinase